MKFVLIIAVIAVLGFGFYYADQQGWIDAHPFNPGSEGVDTRTK